jgi:uncharacterized protein with PIN domain
MECPDCNKEMELKDTTYSNCNTNRTYIGQYTGDIYYCEKCDQFFLDDFLTGKLETWSY